MEPGWLWWYPGETSVLVSWVLEWTLQYYGHLMCLGIFTHRIPCHPLAEILTDKASARKLSSVCTYTQWVPMLSFPRNNGHGELLPHPDSPISISGPTECLLLSLRPCWFILTLHTWMCVNLEITWTLCSAMVWMRGGKGITNVETSRKGIWEHQLTPLEWLYPWKRGYLSLLFSY